ncbi:MAG: glycosyltransferase [Proteocatella sp.]
MKLSIPMMVKNESKYLKQVLESLKPIMEAVESELIIIDTGSEDDTVEIARRYTDRVYFHKWNNDFSQMRNITLGYAKGEWLLVIDGDEVLENPQPIIDFLLSKKRNKTETGLLSIRNITNENDDTTFPVCQSPRIFRNRPDFRYTGAVHNQPSHKLPYQEIPATLIHYGYISTDKELMEKKFKRTGEILRAELEKDPGNIYYWYQLSVTYSMHKDDNLAIEPIEKAYSLAAITKSGLRSYIYIYPHMIMMYISIGDFDKAEKICEEALDIADKYPDINFFAGKIKAIKNEYEEASRYYMNYLDLLQNFEGSEFKKDITLPHYSLNRYEEVYGDLSIICLKLEKYRESLAYYDKLKNTDLRLKHRSSFINSCIKLYEYDRLKKTYEDDLHSGDRKSIETFEMHIENARAEIDDTKRAELESLFSEIPSDYAVLNRVRIIEREASDKIDNDVLGAIEALDFSEMPIFYGDIIYYMMKRKQPLSDILSTLNLAEIRLYLDDFVKKDPEFHVYALEYIKNSIVNDIKDARVNKELEKYALLMDNLEDEDFSYMLERYLEDGIYYIKKLYHPDIIEKEMVSEIKEQDEAFLLYLYKGRLKKNSDPAEYVRYLKKAIQVYPFKKAIEVLKDEMEHHLNPPVNEEMESLKKQFKENIKVLIAGDMIDQAEEVIRQYEQIINGDLEILLFKSQISLMKSEEKDNR